MFARLNHMRYRSLIGEEITRMRVNISAVSMLRRERNLKGCVRGVQKEKKSTRGVLSCSEIRRLNLNGAAIRCISVSFSPPPSLSFLSDDN